MYVKSHKLIIPLEKFSSKLKKFSKSRDTKIRLSKLDDEIFNGVSSLNNKIEKLSAEISLLDSHLSYLKENSIKKTDREWTRVKNFETEILNFESHTHKDSTSKNDIKAAENKISLLREEVSQVKAYLGYKAEVALCRDIPFHGKIPIPEYPEDKKIRIPGIKIPKLRKIPNPGD